MIKHVANGALDSVAWGANNLRAALDPSRTDDVASLTVTKDFWDRVAFRVLHLYWSKSHLRAVKSEFEDLYRVTVESYINSVCEALGSAGLLPALLKALVAVDASDTLAGPQGAFVSDEEEAFASAPYSSILDPTHSSNDPGSALCLSSDAPIAISRVDGILRFEQAMWTVIAIKRWWRHYKQTKILKELLTSIGQENHTPDSPVWLQILSRYPIFTDCPDFLDTVKPHIQLQGYDADQIILAKGDCAAWVGWVITGTTWYIATYNHNNERRKWMTEETGITIGLVGTLFGLLSLIEHRTKTPCLLVTLPKAIFDKLVESSPEAAWHIAAKNFGAPFDLTRECLRIEVEFGYPWWHIFHTIPSSDIDRPIVAA